QRDHDHVTLKPHADERDYRNDEQNQRIQSPLLDPKNLRTNEVAEDQAPIRPAVWSEHSLLRRPPFIFAVTVPRHPELAEVAVTDHHAGAEHDLGTTVDVPVGDEILESVP